MRRTSARLTLPLILAIILTACGPDPPRPTPLPQTTSTPLPSPIPGTPPPTLSPSLAPLITTPSATLPADRILARIPVGDPPTSISAGPLGVWVLLSKGDTSAVVQIDPITNRIIGEPVQIPFHGAQIEAGEGALWVASNGQETIARIDPLTRQITLIPVLPGNFIGVGAGSVWLANSGIRDTVQQIDPTSGRVISTFRVGPNPYGIAIGAGSLWVPKHDDVTLSRIDPTTNTIVAEIPLPFAAHGIAYGAETVWIIDYHGQALWPLDPSNNRLGAAINLQFLPTVAAVGEKAVWLPAYDENDTPITEDWITRIDPVTHEVLESLRIGEPVGPLAISEGSIWLTLQSGAILRIRP